MSIMLANNSEEKGHDLYDLSTSHFSYYYLISLTELLFLTVSYHSFNVKSYFLLLYTDLKLK